MTLALVAGCSDDAGIPDARPATDAAVPGQLSLTWAITHLGAPLTCAQVDAAAVTIQILPVGAAFGVVDSVSCTSGSGMSRPLAPGTYDVRITLDGAAGRLDGPETRLGVVIAPGQTVALAPIGFDVDPHGDLVFRIATPTNGNCTPAAQGGAGITAMTIAMRDAAGVCVPTTFVIAAGASQPAGTYVSDCAGASHGCIATDQDLRVVGLTSGQHSMVLSGTVAAAPCWSRTTSFRVPGANLVTTLNPQQLNLDTAVPGCPAP